MLNDFEELSETNYLNGESTLFNFLIDNLPDSKKYNFTKINNDINYFLVYDLTNKIDDSFVCRLILKAKVYNLTEAELFTEQDNKIFENIEPDSCIIGFIQINQNYQPVRLQVIKKIEIKE